MPYTLGQAARATGKAKPTIARAIQTGRISASRSDDGAWQIDPAELHRVYPMTGQTNGTMLRDLPAEPATTSLADLLVERDRLVAEQVETIRDLRDRLDREAEERRKLTAILTGPRRPWWRRWFR
jgi:hypothetical protein